ncbi:facilitated trehalose transporter Tret1-like [Anthonomus grandis grandis]|uniref:facilitated trehalose transporter Tret1-like n=1 Tax=Anthonomus grandis grandis TaxID=2921223 RepID=UPI002166205E|nr:facilitated trehalose transporter Tret1-like [Anthonomus grandis grandis]XP_050315675.1 facilitated trehalose transporter Tret1-like [Anthonomus grandis grandis]
MMEKISNKLEKFWEFGIGRLFLAAICAHSVSISIGITQGYSAIWLPQLRTTGNFDITDEQSSWLASLGAITNPIGSVLSGVLAELLGRKRSIQLSTIPFVAGWILIGLGQNVYWLYAGRLVTGIAGGMSTASYTYVGEISTPSTRGFLQALGPICASFGILLTYILGYIVCWKTVALISISFAIFSAVSMQLLPESPAHLMKSHQQGMSVDNSETFKAYLFFSRNVALAEQEIRNNCSNNKNSLEKTPEKSLKELYMSPETIKPFFLLVILFLLQELSGIYSILYYAVQFFGETNLQINDYISSIFVGTIRFLMSIVCALLIQKIGRKTLCTFSSFGMALSVLILGLYIKYYEINPSEQKILPLLPLFCIVINVFFSMIGMLPIPWILVGEMFPLRVRPIMAGIVICIAQCFIFVCVKIYNNMVDFLGFSGTIFTFFIASALAMLFCKYVLPETHGKSLEEIEALFKGSEKKERHGVDNLGFSISSENVISVVTR